MPEHNIPKAAASALQWDKRSLLTGALVERPFAFEDECLLCQRRMGQGQVREDL
jgi:hypothetical protein